MISEKTRKKMSRASKGRHTLKWHIAKYGQTLGREKYKQWCEFRRNVAINQESAIKSKTYEQFYGSIIARKLKKKISIAHRGKTQSVATRQKRSKSLMGRVIGKVAREKISTRRRNKFLSGELTLSYKVGYGRGGFKKDIGHYIRSSYEHKFAQFLKQLNIDYCYEKKHFRVVVDGKDSTFTPDFNVRGKWIEIKNSYNVKDELFNKKLKSFKELYPNEKIFVVVGNCRKIKTWDVMKEQADLVDIKVKLSPLAVIKGPSKTSKHNREISSEREDSEAESMIQNTLDNY